MPTITKERIPDFEVFDFNNPARLDYELKKIESFLPEIKRAKTSEYCLNECGKCDYCRKTKKLFGPIEAESIF